MLKLTMRKAAIGFALIGLASLLAGCKSNTSTDNATATQINTQSTNDIGVPPVPPEPTRPAN